MLQEPLGAPAELRKCVPDVRFVEDLHGQQRDQPDQRAELERRHSAVHQELVVVEAVLVVPQAAAAQVVEGVGDEHKVLEELAGHVLVRGVAVPRQLQSDTQHAGAVEAHPRRSVGLLQISSGRQRPGTVEHAEVVHAQEAAAEDVATLSDPSGLPTR